MIYYLVFTFTIIIYNFVWYLFFINSFIIYYIFIIDR